MRLKRMIEGLARTRSGWLVLSGLAAVLGGVEKVLTVRQQSCRADVRSGSDDAVALPAVSRRLHYFTIRQTRSELGYVYWVLQGFGWFQSFTLFDTWAEAMQSADARLSAARNTLKTNADLVSVPCD